MGEWCAFCGHEESAHMDGMCADCHSVEMVDHEYQPEPRPHGKPKSKRQYCSLNFSREGWNVSWPNRGKVKDERPS